jgi:hypothetical protein
VVGVAAGAAELLPGATVLVDGAAGTVEVQEPAPATPQPVHDEVAPAPAATPLRHGDEQGVG